jgi:prevent-host-death family protein
MKIINIQEAKTHLSRYVDDVAAGAELIIGKAGKPLVRLVPYQPEGRPRVGGQLKGRIHEAKDCWTEGDDELAASIASPILYPKTRTRKVAEPRRAR